MPSTKIVLFKHKAKNNNEVPLYIRVIKNRKPKYVSLRLYINPKYWDEKSQCVKNGHPNSLRINNYLTERKSDAFESVLKLETANPNASSLNLKKFVMKVCDVDFFKYAEKLFKQYELKGKIGTFNRCNTVINKLAEFVGVRKLLLDNITTPLLKDYEVYMRTKFKNTTNTIASNYRVLRRVMNEAIKDEIITYDQNPFNHYKMRLEPSERVFLTEEELAKVENLNLVKGSMKYHHRNMYVFACYAGGMRISDIIQLKWENISNDHIIINTRKTGSAISVKMPLKALAIIELYKSKKVENNDFIFPLLDKSDKLDDPKILHSRISAITAYTNTDLKDLATAAGIEKHIHFHTSRHTWATRALRKGMRIEYVSKLMGHNSIRTTQVYTKIVNADLDKAMEIFDEVPAVPEEMKKQTGTTKK